MAFLALSQLRDCELGATLNRELKQRVRPVNGLTVHKAVARNDIKLAARIIQNLDRKWGLWVDQEEEKKDPEKEVRGGNDDCYDDVDLLGLASMS